ncbi:MAG: ATP-binding protein [Ferrovibrionaceae bacterium]
MRRFLPNGIAARFALTVVAALVLLQAVSAAVFWIGRDEARQNYPPRVLAQRVTAVVRVLDQTSPSERQRIVHALDEPNLEVRLRDPSLPPPQRMGPDGEPGWFGDAIRRRVRSELEDERRPVLISAAPPPPRLLGLAAEPPAPRLRILVRLADGQWVVFSTGDDSSWTLRLGLWLLGSVVVIGGLSVLAAQRISAPLRRFAAAAERLGMDGEAPPLPELGPSELKTATRAFNQMQERLRRFVADRTQMLAAISHDLRTPLTRMRLRADLIDDDEIQGKMIADVDEMEQMVAATMAFARDDARSEARVPVDLADLLQSLVEGQTDAGAEASYAGPDHFALECRPVALRRAFGNLIDNAVKHGGGAQVGLTVEATQVTVTIDDDGPGIPPEEIEEVFTPFHRVDRSRSKDTGGVGLGLAIARTVLRRHGGDVVLANRPGAGLRATVVLPLATV